MKREMSAPKLRENWRQV